MRKKTFLLRRSDTPGQVPDELLDREIGVNTADRLVHYLEDGEIKTYPLDDLPAFLVRCFVEGFQFRGP